MALKLIVNNSTNKIVSKYEGLNKLDLLDRMIEFQERRIESGGLNSNMAFDGIDLFSRLNAAAETPELRQLTQSYINHLKNFIKLKEVI